LAEAGNDDDASLPAGGGNMIYALEIFTKNKSHSLSLSSSLSLSRREIMGNVPSARPCIHNKQCIKAGGGAIHNPVVKWGARRFGRGPGGRGL